MFVLCYFSGESIYKPINKIPDPFLHGSIRPIFIIPYQIINISKRRRYISGLDGHFVHLCFLSGCFFNCLYKIQQFYRVIISYVVKFVWCRGVGRIRVATIPLFISFRRVICKPNNTLKIYNIISGCHSKIDKLPLRFINIRININPNGIYYK